MGWCMISPLLLMVVTSGVARPAERVESAKEALEAMQQAASEPDSEAFRSLFTEEAVKQVPADLLEDSRIDMGVVLAAGRVGEVKEEGEEAVALLDASRNIFAVLMRRDQGAWRLDSVSAYLVKGQELKDSAGKKNVTVELTPRTDNAGYGDSAYCFTYVTKNPAECKGRFDVWFCHNQDLHASKDGLLVDLDRTPLGSVKTIPVGVKWQKVVPAVAGHTYVLHCLDRRDRDFFVKFQLKSTQGKLEFDWTLLGLGRGAPSDVHAAQPLVSEDGADGCDGLCGKNG